MFFFKRYYKLRNSIQQDHGIRKDVTHWNSSGNWENYGNSWDLLRQNPMAATPFLDWELTRKHDGFGNIICDNHWCVFPQSHALSTISGCFSWVSLEFLGVIQNSPEMVDAWWILGIDPTLSWISASYVSFRNISISIAKNDRMVTNHGLIFYFNKSQCVVENPPLDLINITKYQPSRVWIAWTSWTSPLELQKHHYPLSLYFSWLVAFPNIP